MSDSPPPQSADISSPVADAALAMVARLEAGLKPGLDEKLQKHFASLIALMPKLATANNRVLDAQASIAVSALLADPPNIELAKDICENLESRVSADGNPIRAALRSGSPAVRVVFGLAVLLYFVIPISAFTSTWFARYDTILGINTQTLVLVAFSGALGSIVSIMVRLHEFSRVEIPDKSILFFTGLFKPIIGTAFALFIFAILSSGLIPVVIQQEKAQYFFAALSFVAGFSERFAQDVVARTEAAINQQQKADA